MTLAGNKAGMVAGYCSELGLHPDWSACISHPIQDNVLVNLLVS